MAESINPKGLPLGPEPKKVSPVPGVYSPEQSKPSRTPSQELLRFFAHDHLPPPLRGASEMCSILAEDMEQMIPDGPEKTMGLRKLLEAKDCFVRALLPKEGYPLISRQDGNQGTPGRG